MWVFDEDVGLNCRDVTFVPGLYKIFDEILGMVRATSFSPSGLNYRGIAIDVKLAWGIFWLIHKLSTSASCYHSHKMGIAVL